MKDFRGGDEFDWSDTQPDYSHDLIGQWIAKSPSREQSMAFFQACSDVLLKEDSLPADWQRYLVYLMQSASQTVLEDESARTSKLAKVLGLSAGRDLTRRDSVIAYAVRFRVNRDTQRGKVVRACIEVANLLRVVYPEVGWQSVKRIYKKHIKQYTAEVTDQGLEYIKRNPEEINHFRGLFEAKIRGKICPPKQASNSPDIDI